MSQFSVSGYLLDNYINDVDTSNIVSGKPIYYWISQHDKQVPLNAGVVVVVNSTDIVAKDLKLINVGDGIVFAYTNNSVITNITSQRASYGIRMDFSHNNIIDNCSVSDNMLGMMLTGCTNNSITGSTAEKNSWAGIFIGESSGNRIHNNTIQNNEDTGISLEESSNNNVTQNTIANNGFGGDYFPAGISFSNSPDNFIYHNNFIGNKVQVSRYSWEAIVSVNTWDDGYPSGGNYWSDYTDIDLYRGPYQNETGTDGIWDHPYIVDENNRDRYPLMNPARVPTANFIWSPPMPRATKTVTFNASSSTPNTGTIVSYTWNFDDGNTTTTMNPIITHRYADSKRYNVTLTVLNSVGLTDSITESVKITSLADINMDGKVDVTDLAKIVATFGSYSGHPKWNPACDINGDNRIDVYDVAFVCHYFGWYNP